MTEIDVSETAIRLARKCHGEKDKIYHGSVTDMPFDNDKFEGIYCYAPLHLLSADFKKSSVKKVYDHLIIRNYQGGAVRDFIGE